MKLIKSILSIITVISLLLGTKNVFGENQNNKKDALISSNNLNKTPIFVNAKKVINITFKTKTDKGINTKSTGIVYEPKGKVPKNGWPVIAWAHGTLGIAAECTFSNITIKRKNIIQDFLNYFLEKGYAVVASDYPGMVKGEKTQYLNSRYEAISIIDSVIAMHKLPIKLDNNFTIAGHSQGGAAAITAGNIANKVLKERNNTNLKYLGVAGLGIPANMKYAVQLLGEPLANPITLDGAKGFLLYLLAGLNSAYPNLHLKDFMYDQGKKYLTIAENTCNAELGKKSKKFDFRKLFKVPLRNIPGIEPALDEYLFVPKNGYDRPILIAQGLNDITVPFPMTSILGLEMINNKQPVYIKSYSEADHLQLLKASQEDIEIFFKKLLADSK